MRENCNKDAKLGNDLNDGMAGTKSRRGRVESIEWGKEEITTDSWGKEEGR